MWLKRNPIKLFGIHHINDMMKTNNCLQVLDLTNTGLLDDGATELIKNLSDSIKYLYLTGNGITHKTCMILKDFYSNKPDLNLIQLGLGCNRLGNLGAKLISDFIGSNCKLESLEIASCGIRNEGIKFLSHSLRENTTLISLNLGFLKSTNELGEFPNSMGESSIGETGEQFIANALRSNKTLRSLDLVNTGIQQNGISTLIKMVQENNTLLYLHLEQFGIPHNELSREF